MFVAALIVLLRSRRYSRRASSLALLAICGLAGLWLFDIGIWHGRKLWRGQFEWESQAITAKLVIHHVLLAAGILMLVCAVVMDRRPRPPSEAEADYVDNPGSQRS